MASGEAEWLGVPIVDLSKYDHPVPVFMAATPDFVSKHPDAVVTDLQARLPAGSEPMGTPPLAQNTLHRE